MPEMTPRLVVTRMNFDDAAKLVGSIKNEPNHFMAASMLAEHIAQAIADAVAAARADEREACANVCDVLATKAMTWGSAAGFSRHHLLRDLAAAIRTRTPAPATTEGK